MISRRDLKNLHEEAVLHHFKVHLKSQGLNLEILGRPEPPEAMGWTPPHLSASGRLNWSFDTTS